MENMITVPKQFRHLFWDVDISTLQLVKHRKYIIIRVLEYGNEAASEWLKSKFSEKQIKEVIKSERRLSRKSATFWARIYHIPLSKVTALKSQ